MRPRMVWFSLAMTAGAVAGLIVLVAVAAGDSGGRAAEKRPIVSVDDPRLTEAQRRRATALIEETRRALREFPDEASLVAAGYRSIEEPKVADAVAGTFEHFFHADYLADSRELESGRIESVMTEWQPDGSKPVVAAMYMLEPGSTMADAPDIAGELTQWHDHRDLCWDESGTRVEGIFLNGRCAPGGILRPTPPMIHVWLTSKPCGPFAGLEGHGGACRKDHGSRERG